MLHVQARELGDDSEIDYVVPGRLHFPVWVGVFPGPGGKGVTWGHTIRSEPERECLRST